MPAGRLHISDELANTWCEMKIQNESDFKTPLLRLYFDFISKRCKSSRMTNLVIRKQEPGKFSGAVAYKHPVGQLRIGVEPSTIELFISSGGTYPVEDCHVPEVGPVLLRDHGEEVFLVLAHELRHIDQFWSNDWSDPEAAEIDAEKFAVQMLAEAREHLAKYGTFKQSKLSLAA